MRAIDLFAGAGGFSLGAEAAGCRVVWAANHWTAAVDTYRANHPTTSVDCQDLRQADFTRLPAFDLLMASPSCQGHSKARGTDRPHHDAARSTAWAVVECAEACRPTWLAVENVPEFADWPLYGIWWAALSRLGYRLNAEVLDAADCGAPQNRRRLFVVGVLRDVAGAAPELPRARIAPVAAENIIDWSSTGWSAVHRGNRAAATLRRIEAGRRDLGERFLVAFYGNSHGGRSVRRPVGTITTRDRWAIVNGDRMRMFTVDECRRAMGFPDAYRLPESRKLAVHLLGNAVVPASAAWVIRQLRRTA